MRSDSMAALIICLCTIYDSIVGLPYTAYSNWYSHSHFVNNFSFTNAKLTKQSLQSMKRPFNLSYTNSKKTKDAQFLHLFDITNEHFKTKRQRTLPTIINDSCTLDLRYGVTMLWIVDILIKLEHTFGR